MAHASRGTPAVNLYEILVPTTWNSGKPIRTRHHREWDKVVYRMAGGITILPPTRGKWLHNGDLYHDRCIPVRVACTENQMRQLLKFTASHYRQLAVFATKISSDVLVYTA